MEEVQMNKIDFCWWWFFGFLFICPVHKKFSENECPSGSFWLH